MPELPEVEIIRAGLHKESVGRKIKAVTVDNGHLTPHHKSAKDFRALVEARTIKSVSRLGLTLVFDLDNGSYMLMTVGPTGHLVKAKNAKEEKPKHTHVVFTFTTGEELRYVDAHPGGTFAIVLAPAADAVFEISKFARLSVGGSGLDLRKKVPAVAGLGVDPFEDQLGWDRFAAITRSRDVGLKTMLRDQAIFCGLGTTYVDEILFGANLRYDRPASSLSTIEIRRLHRTIPEILTEAIKAGGTTTTGDPFVNLEGAAGSYQNQLTVAGREGLPCETCRNPIVKVLYEGEPTYFCPKCQSA